MADVITRLKVESSEYDAKIQRAAKGLLQMEEACRKVDGTLAILEKEEKQFVESLGSMETVSKTARGRLSELTQAFTDLSIQYKRLTDEEKNGDFGQALSKSLDQLKSRIQDAKKDLDDVNKELGNTQKEGNNTGSILDQLAGKFGMSTKALMGWGAALGAGKIALDVAKDAFFANEQSLDEWGRTVEASESLYKGFLDSLNTGDISGFLSRISQIIQAARDAYNAIDELNTYNAFNQINVEKARTTMTESIVDYREGTGSKDLVKAAGDAYKKELEDRKKLENEAYIEAVGKVAAERGVSKADLLDALSGKYGEYKALKNTMPTGKKTQISFNAPGVAPTVSEVSVTVGREEKLGQALRRLNDDELNNLQALGMQAERTANEIAQVDRQLLRVLNSRQGGGGGGGAKIPTVRQSIEKDLNPQQTIQKQIADLTNEALTADEARRKVIREEIFDLQKQADEYKKIIDYVTGKEVTKTIEPPKVNKPKTVDDMLAEERTKMEAQTTALDQTTLSTIMRDSIKNNINVGNILDSAALEIQAGIDVPDATWQAIIDEYNALREQIGLEPITIKFETGELEKVDNATKDVGKSMKFAASMTQTLGSALSAIEDPGAKVAATVAQAIANVALAYADTLAKDQTSKWNIFSFIAAAAAATVSMATTIASIHSATGYAEGGIIKGSSYSGDRIGGLVDGRQLVGLNAGELVLNKAQQANLAAELTNGSDGGRFSSTPYVTGEKIVLGVNNWAKRNGKGELVFSR